MVPVVWYGTVSDALRFHETHYTRSCSSSLHSATRHRTRQLWYVWELLTRRCCWAHDLRHVNTIWEQPTTHHSFAKRLYNRKSTPQERSYCPVLPNYDSNKWRLLLSRIGMKKNVCSEIVLSAKASSPNAGTELATAMIAPVSLI